jgi:hypothetical protein
MAQTDDHPESALALRRAIYGNGDASRADLEALIAQSRGRAADPEFATLLAEVATDVLVHQVDPEGYVTDADASWLMSHLGDGGGRAELEMLKAVIGHAVEVAPALSAFAMREAKVSILEAGVVSANDLAALRAFAFAAARGSSLHVDQPTAEALFDIAHATATAANDPGFAEVFAQILGGYLTQAAPGAALGPFLALFAAQSHGRPVDQLAEPLYREESAGAEARLEAIARIEAGEAKWALIHLARGGELSPAEKRLIALLRERRARLDHAA